MLVFSMNIFFKIKTFFTGPEFTCSTNEGAFTVTQVVPCSQFHTKPMLKNAVTSRQPLTTIDSNSLELVSHKSDIYGQFQYYLHFRLTYTLLENIF